MSMHASPGVYALLVGSGISHGAGVATGWGVITALVRKMAATKSGIELPHDFDIEAWWKLEYPHVELGYGTALEASGMSPSDRRRLLEPFFLPTEDELAAGQKIPAPAHHAIARLVKRGAVRVIVTTNFDDLLEQALAEVGVPGQIIASPEMLDGCEPLRHRACTIVKVHGDYKRIDLLNTDAELKQYERKIDNLLDTVFDEYGLLVSGWSADWDKALVAAIHRVASRRYPLYWSTVGDLGDNARVIVDNRLATVIGNAPADDFFPALADSLDLLDTLATPPLNRDMAVARLKRFLANPIHALDLRELLDREIERVRAELVGHSAHPPAGSPASSGDYGPSVDQIIHLAETLIHLVVNGVALSADRPEHDHLWIRLVEQLMRIGPTNGYGYAVKWNVLVRFPALMVLKAASFAAMAVGREDLLIRLHREPMFYGSGPRPLTQASSRVGVPALVELYDYDILGEFSRDLGANSSDYYCSQFLRKVIRPALLPIVGDEYSFDVTACRTEFRVALLQCIDKGMGTRNVVLDEITDKKWWESSVEQGLTRWVWRDDFMQNRDIKVWAPAMKETKASDPTHACDLLADLARRRTGLR